MAVYEQFVERALVLQQVVGGGVGRRVRGLAVRMVRRPGRRVDEDGVVDDPGVVVHQRFDRGQAAAVVPTAGVGVALTTAMTTATVRTAHPHAADSRVGGFIRPPP